MNSKRKLAAVLLCWIGIALTTVSSAQVSRGTISGRITDTTGAVIPHAPILATEQSTGTNYKTESDDAGQYTIPFLAPGKYRVNVTVPGFKTLVRENVIVDANVHVGLDIPLEIGAVNEVVTVTSETTLLETASASTGQVLDNEDIENMPVNGRTPLILGQLAYGAISTGNPQFNHPYDNSGPSSVALGGGASKKNELLMDGAPDGGADGTIAYSPPMDATEQVKVETFQSDAAYGHTSGGTVNQVTKSGTNTLHGSAYEFLQLSALNDTPYFTKAARQKKAVTHFHQFGGSIGGPIVVPKVLNGKNKLFFFFAFEGIRANAPNPSFTTVPTAAERSGDFSALLNLTDSTGKPAPVVIYNPFNAVKNSSGRVVRQPFTGNIIPKGMLDKVGLNLVSFFPLPNIDVPVGGTSQGVNNYYYPGPNTDRFDSEIGRIDVNLTNRNKLSYNFRHNDRYHEANNVFGNIATGSILIQPNWGMLIDDVHTFSSSTVWENRANWTRNTESRPLAASFDYSTLGFPASLVAASTVRGFPVTSGTKYTNFGYTGGNYIPYDNFQIFSMLSHIIGKHSLEFGADIRMEKQNSFRYGSPSGNYSFGLNSGQGWTNGPNDNSSAGAIGQELASMLLGLPTTGSFDINRAQTTVGKYLAFFVGDNWRVHPKLTLNLGLRFEHAFPTVESHNASLNGFDVNATSPINTAAQAAFAKNPVTGVTLPTLKGAPTYASADHRNLFQTSTLDVSPRFGFAWTPENKMSLRGGIGVFNNPVGRRDAIALGFSQQSPLVASLDGYLTPYGTLDNPFPTGLTLPAGNSLGSSVNLGNSMSYYTPNMLSDYAIRWNLDLQQLMPGGILFEIGYVGDHAVHLGISRNVNPVPAQYLSVGQVVDAAATAARTNLTTNVANPFTGLLPGTTLNAATVQKQQLLLPYPQYTSVTQTSAPTGSALFDELEMRIEKRLSHGVRFLMNYSWSKKLEQVSYLNPQDTTPEKRISSDDRPQHLVVSGTWELPFGEGRRWRVGVPVASYLASGWNLTSIYTYQPDGAPLSWGDVALNPASGITGLNDLQVKPHNITAAFDKTKFQTSSALQPLSGFHIRTLPTQVSNARADGINSLDLSINKTSRITERLHGQLRADFFNALNHPNFSTPNLSPTSSAFGTISSQANLPRTIQLGLRLVF
jgi:hypothetical protein